MKDEIKGMLEESIGVKKKAVHNLLNEIEKAISIIVECYKKKKKILIIGNGGSAADAQHFAAEMMNRFKTDREPLPALSLSTDSSVLTSIGNDAGFSRLFEKQINALANEGDIVIAITTSDAATGEGHSSNIGNALLAARKKKCVIIGLCSEKSKKIAEIADLAIKVPSQNTPRIQESHITILHIIAELVEKEIFKN